MSLTGDAELCAMHVNGNLVALCTKHVDDLKIAGEKKYVDQLLKALEEAFGKPTVQWHTFTNCGVRHIQDPKTFEITLDQHEYITALKPIQHRDLQGLSSETLLEPQMLTLYQSLLGAVAFAVLTRLDIAVFVVALQKAAHAATMLHVRRLNAVTRYMQRNPQHLTYRCLNACLLFTSPSPRD